MHDFFEDFGPHTHTQKLVLREMKGERVIVLFQTYSRAIQRLQFQHYVILLTSKKDTGKIITHNHSMKCENRNTSMNES